MEWRNRIRNYTSLSLFSLLSPPPQGFLRCGIKTLPSPPTSHKTKIQNPGWGGKKPGSKCGKWRLGFSSYFFVFSQVVGHNGVSWFIRLYSLSLSSLCLDLGLFCADTSMKKSKKGPFPEKGTLFSHFLIPCETTETFSFVFSPLLLSSFFQIDEELLIAPPTIKLPVTDFSTIDERKEVPKNLFLRLRSISILAAFQLYQLPSVLT